MSDSVQSRADAPTKKRARKTNDETLQQGTPENERLLSRRQVASRQNVSVMTVKRREREGVLTPLRFNGRLIRYRLSDVLAYEQAAAGGVK
jgi:DNA-binding transcriptional regulator YhcF (GntR family)